MAVRDLPSLAELESAIEQESVRIHIGHTSNAAALRNHAWCGEAIQYAFRFGSIDHAAYTLLSGASRLLVCRDCISAVGRAMLGEWTLSAGTKPR